MSPPPPLPPPCPPPEVVFSGANLGNGFSQVWLKSVFGKLRPRWAGSRPAARGRLNPSGWVPSPDPQPLQPPSNPKTPELTQRSVFPGSQGMFKGSEGEPSMGRPPPDSPDPRCGSSWGQGPTTAIPLLPQHKFRPRQELKFCGNGSGGRRSRQTPRFTMPTPSALCWVSFLFHHGLFGILDPGERAFITILTSTKRLRNITITK